MNMGMGGMNQGMGDMNMGMGGMNMGSGDPNGIRMERKARQGRGMELAEMARIDLLPTPKSNQVNGCDLNNQKLAERNHKNLEEEIAKIVTQRLLPTTCTRDYKGGSTAIRKDRGNQRTDILDSCIAVLESQVKGDGKPSRLSPLFTEEMMGFPLMWTTLPFLSASGAPKPSKPTATPSSPK